MRRISILALLLLTAVFFSACGGGGGGGASGVAVPVVSITSPANNSTVNGNITIAANASDGTGISKVEFYVDTVLVSTDTSAPYSFIWDSTAARGAHIVTAKAFNAANASTTSPALSLVSSDTISVKVRSVAASAVSIYSISEEINIPLGVTFISAVTSGVAIDRVILNNPVGQNITFSIFGFIQHDNPVSIEVAPFGPGEFMTMNNSLSLGTAVTPADFTIIRFEPKDEGGNPIDGVTAEIY